jgi:hypothetical protein
MNLAFFVVTHSKDYEYLLGSIEHHAAMGSIIVLDSSAAGEARRFVNLPSNVEWVHEPLYGSGWKEFRYRDALNRAIQLALEFAPDVLCYLDADEFYSGTWPFLMGRNRMIELKIVEWLRDGKPRLFGESEWHARIWPADSDVKFVVNQKWLTHPDFNGNDQHHATPLEPSGLEKTRVHGLFHHHVHHALGPKALDEEVARQTVDGWGKGVPQPPVPWPERLALWRDKGILPSTAFV